MKVITGVIGRIYNGHHNTEYLSARNRAIAYTDTEAHIQSVTYVQIADNVAVGTVCPCQMTLSD